jgi:hypothetical protein
MGATTLSADAWLYGLLANDSILQAPLAGRVYVDVAPQGAVYPLVIIRCTGGSDVLGSAGTRVVTRLEYQITAVRRVDRGVGGFADLQTIADRVDDLVAGVAGSIVTVGTRQYAVHGAYRRAPLQYTTVESDGTVARHLGGDYVIIVEEL